MPEVTREDAVGANAARDAAVVETVDAGTESVEVHNTPAVPGVPFSVGEDIADPSNLNVSLPHLVTADDPLTGPPWWVPVGTIQGRHNIVADPEAVDEDSDTVDSEEDEVEEPESFSDSEELEPTPADQPENRQSDEELL